tara:strand:- start:512 stop:730 length:219 start_codon:yes stop_codon:yes gene_type:complete
MKYNQLTFILEKSEIKRAKKWIKKQNKRYGNKESLIEDRFSYNFTPTNKGDIASIIDHLTGKSKVITDLKHW